MTTDNPLKIAQVLFKLLEASQSYDTTMVEEGRWQRRMTTARADARVTLDGFLESGALAGCVERQRQEEKEGWSPEHDDAHTSGELAAAATCYSRLAAAQADPDGEGKSYFQNTGEVPHGWPWEREWWKPSTDPQRNLAKSIALNMAEWDRLKRLKDKGPVAPSPVPPMPAS